MKRWRVHLPNLLIAVTLLLCLTALWCRRPLQGRWIAAQVRSDAPPQQLAAQLGALADLGEDARWGVSALVARDDPRVRRVGLLAVQQFDGAWATALLQTHAGDPDPNTALVAAAGLLPRDPAIAVGALQHMVLTAPLETARVAAEVLAESPHPAAAAARQGLRAGTGERARDEIVRDTFTTPPAATKDATNPG